MGLSKQTKSVVWFILCAILQKAISFITVPIFTRLLSSEEYGVYSLYLAWLQILTIFTSLYLYYGVSNNALTKFESDRDAYISSMQGLTLSITIFYFIIYIIAPSTWSEFFGLSPVFLFLMFAELLVGPSLQFWAVKQRFEFRYRLLVVITLAKSIINPVLGIILVYFAKEKDVARVSSSVIVEVLFCVTIMILQFIKGKKIISSKYWKYALGLAIPLLPHYLSSVVLNQADRIMIGYMVGKSEVAFYSIACNIGALVQIVTTAIINSFTPWIYQKIKVGDYSNIKSTINFLCVIVAIVSFGLMLCSPELVLIFGSHEYMSSVYVIPPVAASVFFMFLYNVLAIPQFYFEQTRFLAISSIVAAIMNIILNFIFIKLYGFIAAGYTTLICYLLYSFGHYLVTRIVISKYSGCKFFYDKKFIASLSMLVIIIGIVCNSLFEYWYIRYAIILVICICGIIMRKQIILVTMGLRKKD